MKTNFFKTTLLLFGFALNMSFVLAQPTVTLTFSSYGGGNNVSCFGGSDGWVTATPSGGTPPYTYLWSNGATTQTINNLPASYYAVTVTDNVGAAVENGVTLREPAQIVITLTSPEYSNGYNVSCWNCFNGSINTSVSGGVSPYSYSWVDGPTSQNRSSMGGGTFRVTVTDANNCTADKEITLTEPSRDDWTMTGNTGSNPNIHYIGTADNTDLLFRTNATERIRIKSNGNIGIGTNNPLATLDVNGTVKIGGPLTVTNLTPVVGSDPCENFVVVGPSGNLLLLDPNNCASGPLLFWSTLGNALPNNASGRFIGTVNNYDFRIRTNDVERMIVKADGRVGIGTSDPTEKLQIGAEFVIHDGGNKAIARNFYYGGNPALDRRIVTGKSSAIYFGDGDLGFRVVGTGNAGDPITWNEAVTITNDGKVSIGIATNNMPGSYKLYVADGILTEKLKVAVKTTSSWSDFVFNENYKLISLPELEKYIKENKHLPNIPNAEEVTAKGIDVAEMDAKLLLKIEELTLYLIDLKKENEEIRNKLKQLENK